MTLNTNEEIGGFTIDCDHKGCHRNLEIEGDFDVALQTLKEEKWWFAKQGGYWKHYCPDHKPNYYRGVAKKT